MRDYAGSDVHPSLQQVAFANPHGPRFFAGGRQSGKTTGVALRAISVTSTNEDVVVGAPTEMMLQVVQDAILDLLPQGTVLRQQRHMIETAGGDIRLRSFYDGIPKRLPAEQVHIIIDEAQELNAQTLVKLFTRSSTKGTVAFAGTPRPNSVFNMYAKYGRFGYVTASSGDNPAVSDSKLADMKAQMRNQSRPDEDRVKHQIYGEF